MFPADAFLNSALDKRKAENAFRVLKNNSHLVDFCSNDYLGFSRCSTLKKKVEEFWLKPINPFGATGSRLLKGNSSFAEDLEREIAHFHGADAGLIYNSGYDANLGLFSTVPQQRDTLLYDELVHASIHDGMRLSKASRFPFRHNDIEHLEQRLASASGNIYVAVESIYSMDGDMAPLQEIERLCRAYKANLIVDEAHATGFFGPFGKGRVVELGLEKNVFARLHTFGKALGCHGAIVLGNTTLREYQINFSRPFIYTTALPIHSLVVVKCSYDMLSYSKDKILKTSSLVNLFKSLINIIPGLSLIESSSPIQCLLVPGNAAVRELADALQLDGFDVRPILSPTVKKGSERLRICLHAYNTIEEVIQLSNSIKKNI